MRKCILVVEPDAVLAQTYAKALGYVGFQVNIAHDAQSAIMQADEQNPDLIILELQLPAHNGVEFLYELRSYTDWRHIPVIVHSYTPPQDLEPMKGSLQQELGVTTFCYKPRTSLEQLIQITQEQLSGAKK